MPSKPQSLKDNTHPVDYQHADKAALLDMLIQKDKRIKVLEESLRLARSQRFGRSSEQSDAQEHLFDEAESIADEQLEAEENDSIKVTSSQAKKPQKTGRKPFAPELPRKPAYLTLSDAEKAGAIETFFTKVKEELDIIPAQVQVIEYYQEKAVFADKANQGQRQIKAA